MRVVSCSSCFARSAVALARAARGSCVAPAGAYRSIVGAGVAAARDGDTVDRSRRASIAEPLVVVDKRLALVGNGEPVLDGEGKHALLLVTADDVTVRGACAAQRRHELRRGSSGDPGESHARGCDDRAQSHREWLLRDLSRRRDRLPACGQRAPCDRATRETEAGNGIHLWTSRRITIDEQRDLAVIATASTSSSCTTATCADNTSTHNLRYGLHFMYSDDCRYAAEHVPRTTGRAWR